MGYPKKPVVLVVDDTIANIRILDDLLRGEYTVRVATNGATALRLALSEPRPDIVLLDIMMPDMDGYEVCRRLKSDPLTSNIAVVFITAMGNEEHEAKGLDLGAVDFIAKPFQPRLVRARVSNHVALKKYNDELNSLVKERTKELYLSRSVTVECLASVVETRDNKTGAHVRRTQHGVESLAKRLRLMRPDIWEDVYKRQPEARATHGTGRIPVRRPAIPRQGIGAWFRGAWEYPFSMSAGAVA